MSHPFRFDRAISRRPGASVVKGLRAGGGPDPSLAGVLAEHAAYVAALEAAGLAVTLLEPLEDFPDAIFVEDPALVFPDCAILLNPGTQTRAGEGAFLRPTLEKMFETVLDLPEGHADGGDVLAMDGAVYIGLSARTDRTGAEALARLLEGTGRKAVVAETPPSVLHLKTASSIVDEETILATRELAASGVYNGYRVLEIPAGEEAGANVLRVNDTILAGSRFPHILDLLDGHGAKVVCLENSEIEKIDAGFTCMSLRWFGGL
ncbi:MAG: arginine deiminase family protein [Pseudomonadota bacterium]